MMRVRCQRGLVTLLVLASALAGADTPRDEDDAIAVRERGLVLAVGRSHYLIIAPLAHEPPHELLHEAVIYYGDGKTFYRQMVGEWQSSELEDASGGLRYVVGLSDWRSNGSAYLATTDEKAFTIKCDTRTVPLPLAPEATAKKLVTSAKLVRDLPGHAPYLLARSSTGMTYYFVDRPLVPADNHDFRLFIGKRGAMKQLKITDMGVDTKGVSLVTSQGLFHIVLGTTATASFGRDEDDQKEVTVVPIAANLKLVYGDLGVYTHESFAMPCDDL